MEEINYEIHYSYRRSITLKIDKKGGVVVFAPIGISPVKVVEFLKSKKNWITKHIKLEKERQDKIEELGFYSEKDIIEIRKKAKELIPQRVEYYAKLGGFKYNRLFFKVQKTLWGSCSSSKNLNFNCLLVLMPLPVLDSVVVHELCHLHHMDHSKDFYDEVISLFPDYRKWNKWIKENGPCYMGRVK